VTLALADLGVDGKCVAAVSKREEIGKISAEFSGFSNALSDIEIILIHV